MKIAKSTFWGKYWKDDGGTTDGQKFNLQFKYLYTNISYLTWNL